MVRDKAKTSCVFPYYKAAAHVQANLRRLRQREVNVDVRMQWQSIWMGFILASQLPLWEGLGRPGNQGHSKTLYNVDPRKLQLAFGLDTIFFITISATREYFPHYEVSCRKISALQYCLAAVCAAVPWLRQGHLRLEDTSAIQ